VTPKSTAFAIWAVIFSSQAIFVILQLLPRFRGAVIVQQGVGYWYIATCTTQVAWTLAFAYEQIALSLVLIVLVWLSLVGLVYSQYYAASEGGLVEFVFFQFPFSIHCGWLTAASTLNVSLVLVDQNASAALQLAVGIVSLAYLHAVSVWVVFGLERPNYTIAAVLAWANAWIYAELQEPKESIVERFCEDTISGVSYAAGTVALIILAQIVVGMILTLAKQYLGRSAKGQINSEVQHDMTSYQRYDAPSMALTSRGSC
jgi:translocator protein